MLRHLVSFQAAKLCGLVGTDITIIRLARVHWCWFDALVLRLLVPLQTAPLCGHIATLVTRETLRVAVFCLLRLDAARLAAGVVHLVEAVPEKETSTNEHFF